MWFEVKNNLTNIKGQELILLIGPQRVRNRSSLPVKSLCQAQYWAHLNHVNENLRTLM